MIHCTLSPYSASRQQTVAAYHRDPGTVLSAMGTTAKQPGSLSKGPGLVGKQGSEVWGREEAQGVNSSPDAEAQDK